MPLQYIPCACENCGKPLLRKPWRLRNFKHQYCTRTCWDLHRRAQTVERFWSKVNKDGPVPQHRPHLGPCWVWTGLLRGYGYGKYDVLGRAVIAHRYSYELAHGPIPDGMLVRHECDNPACVNPAHLSLGTVLDNVADKVARGRAQHGEMCYNARLTEESVRYMRMCYAMGWRSTPELGRAFGVSTSNAWKIVTGQAWKHVA